MKIFAKVAMHQGFLIFSVFISLNCFYVLSSITQLDKFPNWTRLRIWNGEHFFFLLLYRF